MGQTCDYQISALTFLKITTFPFEAPAPQAPLPSLCATCLWSPIFIGIPSTWIFFSPSICLISIIKPARELGSKEGKIFPPLQYWSASRTLKLWERKYTEGLKNVFAFFKNKIRGWFSPLGNGHGWRQHSGCSKKLSKGRCICKLRWWQPGNFERTWLCKCQPQRTQLECTFLGAAFSSRKTNTMPLQQSSSHLLPPLVCMISLYVLQAGGGAQLTVQRGAVLAKSLSTLLPQLHEVGSLL